MIQQIDVVAIPVRDQDRALTFYRDKLGFRIVTDQPMGDGQRWIELKLPGTDTGIALFTAPGHESRIGTFTGISFSTDDVEATYRELSARGVTFVSPPETDTWGTMATFQDPDGNSFWIASY